MEYQRTRRIRVTPDAVFASVTDFGNLPTYVAMIKSVEPVADGRARLQGTAGDARFEEEIWLHVDHNQRGVEWGTDDRRFHGWITVTAADDDADATEVVAHLSLPPYSDESGAPLMGERAEEPDPVEERLEAALDSLRDILEGTRGTERPGS